MSKILFLIKSIALTTLSGILAGMFIGSIISTFKPDHPHQIIPTWFILAGLSGIAGLVLSIVVSTIMIYLKKMNLKKQLAISGIIILILNIALIVKILV